MTEPTEPLTWCERCRHWLPDGCELGSLCWPDEGDQCIDFEREPEVDDG